MLKCYIFTVFLACCLLCSGQSKSLELIQLIKRQDVDIENKFKEVDAFCDRVEASAQKETPAQSDILLFSRSFSSSDISALKKECRTLLDSTLKLVDAGKLTMDQYQERSAKVRRLIRLTRNYREVLKLNDGNHEKAVKAFGKQLRESSQPQVREKSEYVKHVEEQGVNPVIEPILQRLQNIPHPDEGVKLVSEFIKIYLATLKALGDLERGYVSLLPYESGLEYNRVLFGSFRTLYMKNATKDELDKMHAKMGTFSDLFSKYPKQWINRKLPRDDKTILKLEETFLDEKESISDRISAFSSIVSIIEDRTRNLDQLRKQHEYLVARSKRINDHAKQILSYYRQNTDYNKDTRQKEMKKINDDIRMLSSMPGILAQMKGLVPQKLEPVSETENKEISQFIDKIQKRLRAGDYVTIAKENYYAEFEITEQYIPRIVAFFDKYKESILAGFKEASGAWKKDPSGKYYHPVPVIKFGGKQKDMLILRPAPNGEWKFSWSIQRRFDLGDSGGKSSKSKQQKAQKKSQKSKDFSF